MKTTIPYTVEHSLHGETHVPTETYEREIDGKWYAFIVVNGLVFRNKQAFNTRLEAFNFNRVTKREGATIE